jgi:stage II sporulation protein AA (anti-sigma F factor antagonist)
VAHVTPPGNGSVAPIAPVLAASAALCNRDCVDQDGPEPFFSATAEVAGNTVSVRVAGEVDMATADRMYRAAVADGAGSATLDLSAVTFFDSAAIHALIRLAERYPGALAVLPSAQVRRVLEISGLADQPWLRKSDG